MLLCWVSGVYDCQSQLRVCLLQEPLSFEEEHKAHSSSVPPHPLLQSLSLNNACQTLLLPCIPFAGQKTEVSTLLSSFAYGLIIFLSHYSSQKAALPIFSKLPNEVSVNNVEFSTLENSSMFYVPNYILKGTVIHWQFQFRYCNRKNHEASIAFKI